MANLPEAASWETGIYQLEETDPVQGGPNGIDNQQAKQLANRTLWLKQLAESLGSGKLNISALATQAEAIAGADNTKWMTPLRVAQAIAALASIASATETVAGKVELATSAETVTGADTQRATHPAGVKAAIDAALAALVNSAPGTLNTLNELAVALGNDANFAATMTSALSLKSSIQSVQKAEAIISIAGGTADAITASYTPAISALSNGMTLYVRAGSANTTTTPTFTPSSGTIAPKTIVKGNGLALANGDIAGTGHWIELQYDATLDKWVLQNPATGVNSDTRYAQLAAKNTFTKGNALEEKVLPATTGSVTFDFALGNNFGGTLTGNITLANPLNMSAGHSGIIRIVNASPPRTIAYGSVWKTPGGSMPALTPVAGAVDVFGYYVESASRITLVQQADVK